MNSHLSSEQLDGVLMGEASQDAARHLSGCALCAGELTSLREVFGDMREATAAAAAHHQRFVATAGSRKVPRMAWALACVALFVSVTAPVALHHRDVAPVVQKAATPAAVATISDEALLNSVQNDLSTSVPESLLPLTDTSTNATNSKSEQRKN
jgi:hypothetical protein